MSAKPLASAPPHSGDWQLFDDDFITGYLGIGQAWGDYDRDGWLDLYVTGNRDPSVLYRNNGDGTFSVSHLTPQVALADRGHWRRRLG